MARDQAAPAEVVLLAAGALAVTLQDAADRPVLEPAPGEMPLWPSVVITGLFAGDCDPLAVLAAVHDRIPGVHWRIASLAERAWEREWLRDFQPLRFGTRLAVVPVGMTPPAGAVVLRLDPGLAFGTGTHATTALCLEWLDALGAPRAGARAPLEGALALDYGCGSGILAIAALLLGAAEAVAVDIDPQALLATRANAEVNDVAARITACSPGELPAVLRGRKADILVANVLAAPLHALLPEFAALLEADGRMALSGILASQEVSLAAAAEPWFLLDRPATKEGWVRLSGRRKTAS
ncbi:MAG TPA: 50S ribosomal protein L11 methyltransferase [Gammaproteobacteria bacterium]|nr:50S ribosomal protein L11 methyltransferase [Gammaproteobacteria bacterium]